MSRLIEIRDDIATVVASVLSIDAFGGWRGQIEPKTVRVVAGDPPHIDQRHEWASFGLPVISWQALVIVHGQDIEAAEEDIASYSETLLAGLGGQTLANGGECPPVADIGPMLRFTAPSTQDVSSLLHAAVSLVPIPFDLT